MSISKEDVIKIAHLARLELREGEIAGYTASMNQILGHVDALKALNTDQVPATFSIVSEAQTMRRDEVVQSPDELREKVLRAAPAVSDTAFAVPQVIE